MVQYPPPTWPTMNYDRQRKWLSNWPASYSTSPSTTWFPEHEPCRTSNLWNVLKVVWTSTSFCSNNVSEKSWGVIKMIPTCSETKLFTYCSRLLLVFLLPPFFPINVFSSHNFQCICTQVYISSGSEMMMMVVRWGWWRHTTKTLRWGNSSKTATNIPKCTTAHVLKKRKTFFIVLWALEKLNEFLMGYE